MSKPRPRKSGHHDHGACIDRAVATATELCATRGLNLTPVRKRVLEIVWRAHEPIGAYEILAELAKERDKAAPPTVYRALDFLLEHGFIHKLESVNAYTTCHHPSERHSVPFFLCDVCAGATELCDPRVADLLVEQARQLGFLPEAQTLEVHGVCRQCRERDGGRRHA